MDLPTFTDWDGQVYVALMGAHGQDFVWSRTEEIRKRMFGAAWVDHLDDVKFLSGHVCQVIVLKSAWDALPLAEQESIFSYARSDPDDETTDG